MMIIFFDAGIFDVLAYTDRDLSVPITWLENDAKLIESLQVGKGD
jgi:mitotic spindle assembly checkpoint protein MAD2